MDHSCARGGCAGKKIRTAEPLSQAPGARRGYTQDTRGIQQQHPPAVVSAAMETGQETDDTAAAAAASVASTIQRREKPLPPPGDIPSPPASSAHKYRIELKERVVRADFSKCSSNRCVFCGVVLAAAWRVCLASIVSVIVGEESKVWPNSSWTRSQTS